MSVRDKALKGVAWMAGGSWLQLALSLVSFFVITSRLTPAEVGLFGVAVLLVGMAQTLIGGLFTDSLQQRADLSEAQINATFWISAAVSILLALALIVFSGEVAQAVKAPGGGTVLALMALGLPLGAIASTPGALLVRDLRYDVTVRVGALGAISSSTVGLASIFLGAGVFSLVFAELAGKAVRLIGLFLAHGYRPQAPRRLGAIKALMGFNLGSLGTYLLGYADRIVPRALTAGLLGAQGLGYLVIAERMLELLTQSVLSPMGAVTMASVARLQHEPKARNELILGLYRLSTAIGYPAFLGAVVVTPLVMALLGPQWAPAALTVQLMLLVGVRTSTGVFNIAILRGLGQSVGPLLLLGLGLGLNALLVPYGAAFGAAGVAAAVLIRTFATWPLGLWLISRATGVSVGEQLKAGAPALCAALLMALATGGLVQAMSSVAPILALSSAVLAGALTYLALFLSLSEEARGLAKQALSARGAAWTALRSRLLH